MEGGATAVAITSSSFASVLTALQGQISVATVVEVLAVVVGACVGLAFMWWSYGLLNIYIYVI